MQRMQSFLTTLEAIAEDDANNINFGRNAEGKGIYIYDIYYLYIIVDQFKRISAVVVVRRWPIGSKYFGLQMFSVLGFTHSFRTRLGDFVCAHTDICALDAFAGATHIRWCVRSPSYARRGSSRNKFYLNLRLQVQTS